MIATFPKQREANQQGHAEAVQVAPGPSEIPPMEPMKATLADAATGDADFRRKLFTDEGAHIFSYRRVLCLSGISHSSEKPDLLRRVILINLPLLNETDVREEGEYWASFEKDLSMILGGTFDILSKAIALLDQVRLLSHPSMADFAKWGYVIAEAAGLGGSRFLEAYQRNIGNQHDEAIAASSLAQAVISFMSQNPSGEWSPSQLKQLIDGVAVLILNINTLDRRTGWPPYQGFPRNYSA